MIQILIISALGYLLGSIPTGKIIASLKGIDIQKVGSGNIGFANVTRVLGIKSGIIVLIIDIAKGAIPLFIAKNILNLDFNNILLVGLAPILGHAFPIWLKFKGGKSIATGFGVLLVLNPIIATFCLLIYLAIYLITRIAFLASLSAAYSMPIFCLLFQKDLLIYAIILSFFATYTHRTNIKNYNK